jgi:hypothetical protein
MANVKKEAAVITFFAFEISQLKFGRVQFEPIHGRKPSIVSHRFKLIRGDRINIDPVFAQP